MILLNVRQLKKNESKGLVDKRSEIGSKRNIKDKRTNKSTV